MEIGYDYLLMRSRLQQSFIRGSAILLVITGAILLSAGVAYFAYAYKARSDLDKLNATAPLSQEMIPNLASSSIPERVAQEGPGIPGPVAPASAEVGQEPDQLAFNFRENSALPAQVDTSTGVQGVSQPPSLSEAPPPQISAAAIAAQNLYPGEAIRPSYWSNPLEYEPASYIEASFIQGFKPVDASSLPPPGTLAAPSRLIIPAIEVDSEVSGLKILDLGDSRAYETPKHVVGYIPEMANPGEKGSAWFFGHLESPIAREGNVFYNLPKIPGLLRKGEDVYAIVENGNTSFLYRIIETKVVHQDDIKMYDTGGPTIHMVACVPRLVYDHRLIVTGELVGIRS